MGFELDYMSSFIWQKPHYDLEVLALQFSRIGPFGLAHREEVYPDNVTKITYWDPQTYDRDVVLETLWTYGSVSIELNIRGELSIKPFLEEMSVLSDLLESRGLSELARIIRL